MPLATRAMVTARRSLGLSPSGRATSGGAEGVQGWSCTKSPVRRHRPRHDSPDFQQEDIRGDVRGQPRLLHGGWRARRGVGGSTQRRRIVQPARPVPHSSRNVCRLSVAGGVDVPLPCPAQPFPSAHCRHPPLQEPRGAVRPPAPSRPSAFFTSVTTRPVQPLVPLAHPQPAAGAAVPAAHPQPAEGAAVPAADAPALLEGQAAHQHGGDLEDDPQAAEEVPLFYAAQAAMELNAAEMAYMEEGVEGLG
mmetsp:Transcript_36238/g.103991  ORF Transcript_36238/g.103991 Transcript_36238/m.103991 type:complete len:249 (+) Transcript_36238:250-996(+)